VSASAPAAERVIPAAALRLAGAADPAEPPAAPGDGPEWRPGTAAGDVRALVDTVGPEAGWAGLGDFSRALRAAGVLDNDAVALPGTFALLPYGVRLVAGFAALVGRACEARGFEEHDYPFVAPPEALAGMERVLPVRHRVLYAGAAEALAAGEPQLVLCPTGEPVVYSHWARLVRGAGDLPLRVFRRARYYRPISRGKHRAQGVFRSVEAGDVFEFHGCYADEPGQQAELGGMAGMLRAVADAWRVPVLWGVRPPWTNHADVSRWTLGGDVPLPTGTTVQVACLYDQGQIFSGAFGVRFAAPGGQRTPFQLSGAVTRRMVLAHLFLGMHAGGELLVHPDVAPHPAAIVLRPGAEDDAPFVAELAARLAQAGCRSSLVVAARNDDARRECLRLRRAGTPVVILVQGRRSPDDRLKVVLTRADTHGEASLFAASAAEAAAPVPAVLRAVGRAYDLRVRGFAAAQRVAASTEAEVRDGVRARRVTVCPLDASAGAVAALERGVAGEVLGFAPGAAPAPCVVTGVPVSTVAFVSGRV
jgi:hypothetical protein